MAPDLKGRLNSRLWDDGRALRAPWLGAHRLTDSNRGRETTPSGHFGVTYMRVKTVSCALASLLALAFGAAGHAHHGAAAYTDEVLTMKATITDFRFINPHVQVYFDVTNAAGEVEHWQGELTAPNKLARAGWTKNTLQAAEQVEISGRAGRNGGKSVWITKLTKADGQAMQLMESLD